MRLRRPTVFLLVCWAISGALVGAGYLQRSYADARLTQAVKDCERDFPSPRELPFAIESSAQAPVRGEFYVAEGGGEILGEETCDPWTFHPDKVIFHKELFAAKEARWAASERMMMAFVGAAAVGVLGVVPWSWYFLLRRVRELATAIRGEGPKG
jgi:hypothetical protein